MASGIMKEKYYKGIQSSKNGLSSQKKKEAKKEQESKDSVDYKSNEKPPRDVCLC